MEEEKAVQSVETEVEPVQVDEPQAEAPAEGKPQKDWKNLKLNYPQTLKVGLGFAVVMIFWQVYNFVVPLLLEDAFGFSNTIRNLIVGIASAMCMILLPVFGKLSDRSGKTKLGKRFGRRTPFIVIGTVITIVAMILVPISVQSQLRNSNTVRTNYQLFFQAEGDAHLITTQIRDNGEWKTVSRYDLLGSWFDQAKDGDYSHLTKASYEQLIKDKGDGARDYFCNLYNVTVSNDGLMGVGAKHFYKTQVTRVPNGYVVADGKKGTKTAYLVEFGTSSVKVSSESEDLSEIEGDILAISKEDYDALSKDYIAYSAYLADGANDFVSSQAQAQTNWVGWFVFFLIALLFIILAQTIIRTPAVSLMPDVTPSPLRSPGNAMINLIGGVGGGIGFFIYTITFLLNLEVALQYWIIFGAMAIVLALVLGLFILLVREKKWVAQCREICREYGLPTDDEPVEAVKEESNEGQESAAASEQAASAPQKKEGMFKKYDKKTMRSFFLILGAIFMWFLGYYSIANNMSIYCVKILNVSAGIASIVSGASLVVAAIGFIPVGAMARKFGRRISIIFGFLLAVVSYVLVASLVVRGESSATIIFMVCYMVSGFGLIFANVNTLPMVLELASPKDVGTFTGIYYIATMSAQTLGPIFGGLVMDYVGGSAGVFIFAAVCVAVGAILMFFVKHGEAPDFVAKQQAKKAAKANG